MPRWSLGRIPFGAAIATHLGYAHIPQTDELAIDEPGSPISEKWSNVSPGLTLVAIASWLKPLLPSFLHRRDAGEPRRLHPSAWLDGLRGVAACLVVWHHCSLLYFSWPIHNGWGSSEPRYFVQLPFIRLFISGQPQVMVFFVVSGYALSYKPLKLSREARHADFAAALASSALRRHSRLFLPALASSFAAAMLSYWGYFGGEGLPGAAAAARPPPRFPDLSSQIEHWWQTCANMMNPLSRDMGRGSSYVYDQNLWTLPIEFDCSMIVFVCLAAMSHLRPGWRLLCELALIVEATRSGYWQIFLFVSGMMLADLNFATQQRRGLGQPDQAEIIALGAPSPTLDDSHHLPLRTSADGEAWGHLRRGSAVVGGAQRRFSRCWPLAKSTPLSAALWITSFVLAIHLLCTPEGVRGGGDSPGFVTLFSLTPSSYAGGPEYFWVPVGAVWLVFTIDRAPFLQRIFTSRLPQYLGRVSYALYLVHGPLLWSFGLSLGRFWVGVVGGWEESDARYCAGIALAVLCYWPITITVADFGSRFVDVKAVQFGRWAYGKMVVGKSS